jgi:hypothetical protein
MNDQSNVTMFLVRGISDVDEIRVSDPKRAMNRYEIQQALREAKLEEVGFNKTIDFSTGSDKNGKRRRKKIVSYMVKDKCTEAKTWQERLERRLPPNFFSSRVSRTFARDVQDRVTGRSTEYCLIGLEVVSRDAPPSNVRAKRGLWPRVRISVRVRIDMKAKIKYR